MVEAQILTQSSGNILEENVQGYSFGTTDSAGAAELNVPTKITSTICHSNQLIKNKWFTIKNLMSFQTLIYEIFAAQCRNGLDKT